MSLFYLPSIGSRAEIEAGMAGLRGDLYDRMLAELGEQAVLADELGYDSISFTEHHFHIEGFELSNNPVLLDLFVAMQTKRIRVGQLGIVLPADNPIRIAEDIAMLDHMSGGRANAGFARGYQRRWVDVLAQQTHGIHGALPHQHDQIDAANRVRVRGVLPHHQGRLDPGPARLPGALLAHSGRTAPSGTSRRPRLYGGGVIDGVVTQVGVVPKPLQQPHPPLFQPFASSEASIRWCAEEGVTAVLPPLHPKTEARLVQLYAEVSGRPAGDGIGVLRDVIVADSDEEAMALWADSGAFCGGAWFAPFGFSRGLADPDTGETPEDLFADGLALVGTVDTVTGQLERLAARLPVDWLFAWTYNGLVPHEKLLGSLETVRHRGVAPLHRVHPVSEVGRAAVVLRPRSADGAGRASGSRPRTGRDGGPGDPGQRVRLDLHIWRGDGWLGSMAREDGRIIGHEMTGVVHALGAGVSADWSGRPLAEGDRVVYQYFAPCGRCRSCLRGMAAACRHSFGVLRGKPSVFPHFRGAFADYFYVDPKMAVFKVPDRVADTVVAGANCALAQMVHSLERVEVGPGDNVVIQGAGGLGLYGTALAKSRGANKVIVIDGVDDRLELAKAMGADEVIDLRELEEAPARVARVRELTDGWGADVACELVGFARVIPEGLQMLGAGGRYLEVGTFYPGTTVELDPGVLVAQNLRVEAVGSYDALSLQRAVEFLDANVDRLPLDQVLVDFPLEAINDAFVEADQGKVRRASIVMTA